MGNSLNAIGVVLRKTERVTTFSNCWPAPDEDAVAGTLVGRLRIVTTAGRASPWYGSITQGTPFSFGGFDADGDGKFDGGAGDEAVVGFCGRKSANSLNAIGVVLRKTERVTTFSNCWPAPDEDAVGTKKGDEEQTLAEEQFSTVLRLRATDVQGYLCRSQAFAKECRGHAAGMEPIRVAHGTARWFFESCVHGLVAAPDAEFQGRGVELVSVGRADLDRGQKLVAQGLDALSEIPEYSRDGRHKVNAAMMGEGKVRSILDGIGVAEERIARGKEIEAKGEALMAEGKRLMPSLPTTAEYRRYFEKLYRMAVAYSSLGSVAEDYLKEMRNDKRFGNGGDDANDATEGGFASGLNALSGNVSDTLGKVLQENQAKRPW